MVFFPPKMVVFPPKNGGFPQKMVVFHPKNCVFSNLELVFLFFRRSSGCGSFIQMKMVVDWVNGVTVWDYPYIIRGW